MRNAGAKVTLQMEAKGRVNGVEVLMLRFEAAVGRDSAIFVGYFRTSSTGTVQLIAWTEKTLFAEYRREIEDLLRSFWAK